MLVAKDEELFTTLKKTLYFHGGTIDPHQAWLVLRGIRTLGMRVERAQATAIKIADFAKVIRFVTFGRKEANLYATINTMRPATIGHGMLMNRYQGDIDVDRYVFGDQPAMVAGVSDPVKLSSNENPFGPSPKAAYDADGNPTKALQKFAESKGVAVEDCQVADVPGKGERVVAMMAERDLAAPEPPGGAIQDPPPEPRAHPAVRRALVGRARGVAAGRAWLPRGLAAGLWSNAPGPGRQRCDCRQMVRGSNRCFSWYPHRTSGIWGNPLP